MPRVPSICRVLTAAALLGPALASAVAPAGEADVPAPERVLVAPLAGAGLPSAGSIAPALPALLAEAISADRFLTASLAEDLSPEGREALGLSPGARPTAAALAAASAAAPLKEIESVRILLVPSLDQGATAGGVPPALELTIDWTDLVTGASGSVEQSAGDAAGLIEAAGRAAAAARRAWSASFTPAAAPKVPAAPRSSDAWSSRNPDAVAAWARATEAWRRGAPVEAEADLSRALEADPAYARAKADLAWIRLAQGRDAEAASLAGEAAATKRLSPAAAAVAEIIAAAARADAKRLEAIAAGQEREAPGAPWGPLARGLAKNLSGDHAGAIPELDAIRLHRPNDAVALHQAGIAALGVGDPWEAVAHLRRLAAMWPAHDRVQLDLAEALLRSHDPKGASGVLEAWRAGFRPGAPPIWGGSWTIEDPPPPVRAVTMDLIRGSLEKAIETLAREDAAMETGGAPAGVRAAVLYHLHRLQSEVTLSGDELARQRLLNAARTSLQRLTEIVPAEEQAARPWLLGRLTALLRVKEGRIPEARRIRESILAAASLPGYDAGVEAEIDASITLKQADTEANAAAVRRCVEARGSLADLFAAAQAPALARRWDQVEIAIAPLLKRLETWNATRRGDAMLWSPANALLTPFTWSLAGESAWWRGDAATARGRFAIFLAYFRAPDGAFMPFAEEAAGTGAAPAW